MTGISQRGLRENVRTYRGKIEQVSRLIYRHFAQLKTKQSAK